MKLTRSQLAEHLVKTPSQKSSQQVASYLVSNGRSKELDLVLREVELKLSKKGRMVAHVTSAHKLEADQQRSVIKLVKEKTDANSVEIINEIDPRILGGVVIRTPEMEVDLSVRTKLNRLKRA